MRILFPRNSEVAQSSQLSPDQFGLHVVSEPALNNYNGPIPHITNIIFVHGLGGSAEGTWTHASKSFWPSWLPNVKGLEFSRIMTFGYDADWNKIWRPNSLLDISDFGDQLLNHLHSHYTTYNDVFHALTLVLKWNLGSDCLHCS